jgi:hypothetical protein
MQVINNTTSPRNLRSPFPFPGWFCCCYTHAIFTLMDDSAAYFVITHRAIAVHSAGKEILNTEHAKCLAGNLVWPNFLAGMRMLLML